MFKKFAGLQWTWFWIVSVVIYFMQSRFMPTYGNPNSSSTILGNFYWAGLTTVIITWLISLLVKYIIKLRQNNSHKSLGDEKTIS